MLAFTILNYMYYHSVWRNLPNKWLWLAIFGFFEENRVLHNSYFMRLLCARRSSVIIIIGPLFFNNFHTFANIHNRFRKILRQAGGLLFHGKLSVRSEYCTLLTSRPVSLIFRMILVYSGVLSGIYVIFFNITSKSAYITVG